MIKLPSAKVSGEVLSRIRLALDPEGLYLPVGYEDPLELTGETRDGYSSSLLRVAGSGAACDCSLIFRAGSILYSVYGS